jgi:predicted Zn-dependent protease with MMP-like domain
MGSDNHDCDHDIMDLVDEAYGLLEDGDVEGAEKLCEHALSHEAHPEVLTLAGCIACERGAYEEGLERFEQAVQADPSHVVALIDAAEVQLDVLEDPERCLATCDRALPLTEDSPEARLDVLCYRARALMELDRDDEAREALLATKGLEVGDPDALEGVGGIAIALEAWDVAEGSLSAALRIDPDHADAHYGMGWVHLQREDLGATGEHWARTLELDLAMPRPDWHLSSAEFDRVAEEALMELPERARTLLENVPIIVEDMPAVEEIQDGLDPRVLGLFCGAPFSEQSAMDAAPEEPNVIKLYQRNLEAACESREELVAEIRTTLLHETAHFFGLEDEDLAQIGLG